jgi:hypothetical protein
MPAYEGTDIDSIAIYGAQLVDNTDGFIQGPGIYYATTSVTKPRLDLAPTGAPPSIASHLQGSDGNRLMARSFNGATQYYSRAYHAAVNIFTDNSTLTVVCAQDADAGLAEQMPFGFGTNDNTSGALLDFYVGNVRMYYGSVYTNTVFSTTDSKYHIIQVVRNSDVATTYIDGAAGTPVDVTGKGNTLAGNIMVGAYTTGIDKFKGNILYSSLDNKALSAVELANDRELILGIAGRK